MKKISIVLFLTIIIFSGCTKSTNITFTSTIESTQVDVNSEVSGKVDKINFDEGASVKKGDILVVLESSSAQLQVEQAKDVAAAAQAKLDELKAGSRSEQISQAKAAMNAAKANLDQVKSGSRSEQIRQAQASVQQAQNTTITAQKNYDYRLKNLENAKELLKVNGSSQQQIDDLSNLVDAAYQQLKSSNEQSNIAKAQLDLLVNGAAPEAIRAAEAAYQQAKAQYELIKNGPTSQSITIAQEGVDQAQRGLDLAKLQLDKFNVKAPADGQLLYKTVDVGEVVFPGSNIATISEPNDLWLKFYVPETQKHKVAVGNVLNLSSKAYPNEKIQGKVTFVSDKAEFTPKNVETAEAKESTVFEVKVKILNLTDKLKPGMTVNVTIP
jgi:HlyD family secretion protein